MAIEWTTTHITAPEAGREIIAKNPNKEISADSSVKQCRVMKFLKTFTEDMILTEMLDSDYTLWSYTESTCSGCHEVVTSESALNKDDLCGVCQYEHEAKLDDLTDDE